MQIVISIMIVGLLWMIYDIINAPEVDQNENPLFSEEEDAQVEQMNTRPSRVEKKEVSEVE